MSDSTKENSFVSTRGRALFIASEDRFFWGHPLPLARAVRRNGYEVVVATGIHSCEQQIRDEGFRLIPLRFKRKSYSPWNELRALMELRRIYRTEKPEIAYHLSLKCVLYGSIASLGHKDSRVINAVTGLGYLVASPSWKAKLLGPFMWKALGYLLNRPNQRVIVENQEDKELLVARVRVSPEKVVITRGAGVDVTAFQPSPEPCGVPVAVFASRMLWIKGILEFVEAARMLRRTGLPARFVLAGDTDASNPSCVPRQQLAAWQASGDVEWWGHQEDMPQVYRQASLVCLPSHGGEGIPKVLMEAAASGRALVTTDVPGCRDIVRNGLNGIVVQPRNSTALAGALEELLKDPERRRRMGDCSREVATNEFSQQGVVSHILALYDDLIMPPVSKIEGDLRIRQF